MNNVQVIGNLGRDPEVKAAGTSTVCGFSVAAKTRKGETIWYDVSVWGKQGDSCQEYLNKGSKVFVDGALSIDSYQTKDGEDRTAMKLNANNVQFLTPKSEAVSDAPSTDSTEEIPF